MNKPGLYANILAKQERIKAGSGEKMKRPGEKGRPTEVFVQDNTQAPYPVAFFAWDEEGRGWDQANWYDPVGPSANLDRVDVSMTIGVERLDGFEHALGLLAQGAIPIKPGGVETTYLVTSVDEAPLFGWDVENEFVAGWDTGAWGMSPDYLLSA